MIYIYSYITLIEGKSAAKKLNIIMKNIKICLKVSTPKDVKKIASFKSMSVFHLINS